MPHHLALVDITLLIERGSDSRSFSYAQRDSGLPGQFQSGLVAAVSGRRGHAGAAARFDRVAHYSQSFAPQRSCNTYPVRPGPPYVARVRRYGPERCNPCAGCRRSFRPPHRPSADQFAPRTEKCRPCWRLTSRETIWSSSLRCSAAKQARCT